MTFTNARDLPSDPFLSSHSILGFKALTASLLSLCQRTNLMAVTPNVHEQFQQEG